MFPKKWRTYRSERKLETSIRKMNRLCCRIKYRHKNSIFTTNIFNIDAAEIDERNNVFGNNMSLFISLRVIFIYKWLSFFWDTLYIYLYISKSETVYRFLLSIYFIYIYIYTYKCMIKWYDNRIHVCIAFVVYSLLCTLLDMYCCSCIYFKSQSLTVYAMPAKLWRQNCTLERCNISAAVAAADIAVVVAAVIAIVAVAAAASL